MTIKLLTLNIEADRHLDRVRAAIARHLPDVVCLQEVLENDLAKLADVGAYAVKYAPMMQIPKHGERGDAQNWGIAVLTRIPVSRQSVSCYVEDPRLRTFTQPNDARRTLIVTELEHAGQQLHIATTHFTWSPDGEATTEQREDFARLKARLAAFPDYLLCGDFNSPRGREMFARFMDELHLVDHLPATVTTTLDAKFHYAGALELVVDTIFATDEYRVSDVQVLEGISDHKGILASVARKPVVIE